MIPGLAQAIFVRYGQMHRNTFIASPLLLSPALQSKKRPDLLFAGQLTGMEGYTGNIGSGCLAGINAARIAHNRTPLILPAETMLGALLHYITSVPVKDFQPMKANFGILPPLEGPRVPKKERGTAYAQRALQAIRGFSLQ
jgi:methylenetetrahydrofolate--tRNA-(uracil-5-)-methyltransferase